MNVNIRCKVYQHGFLKVSIGDTVCGLDEGGRELPDIEKDLIICLAFWESLHIGNRFSV